LIRGKSDGVLSPLQPVRKWPRRQDWPAVAL